MSEHASVRDSVAPSLASSDTVLVSVIIPTHNFGQYVEDAVHSVLQQQVEDLEVIVVDDGSTDDTAERLARITDPRLRIARLSKVGVGAARNHGLQLARGRFVAFLDSDDRWRPNKLARQLAILDSEPKVGFVFTNFVRFDEGGTYHAQTQFDFVPELATVPSHPTREGGGRVIEGDALAALGPLLQLPCWTQTILIRADAVRGIIFPPDMRLSQDLCYLLNVYRVARGAFISDPLVEVRRHQANSYRRAEAKILPDIEAVARTLASTREPLHQLVLRRRLGKAWLAAGYHYFWAGRFPSAFRAYSRALRYPGGRRRALIRLLASPLAPLFCRLRDREAAAFPAVKH